MMLIALYGILYRLRISGIPVQSIRMKIEFDVRVGSNTISYTEFVSVTLATVRGRCFDSA